MFTAVLDAPAASPEPIARPCPEDHLRLAYLVASRYQSLARRACGLEPEDLVSEAYFGLVHAAERYDPSRGVPFSSYASVCMRGYIFRALTRAKPLPQLPQARDEDGDADAIEPEDPKGRRGIDAVDALDLLAALPPSRERKLVELRFGFADGRPRTLAEVAEVFGISEERARQLQLRAMDRLREAAGELEDYGAAGAGVAAASAPAVAAGG